MARPLRLNVADGIYHVVARGNGQQEIFLDDADRRAFLKVADGVVSRYRWRCLTYCLMGNHYHLVVRTPRANLSRGMRQLNGVYAQRFNRRHQRCGHLFQGRFGAWLVVRDSHLLELGRYVALNPVRAGLCNQPEEWRWSAHRGLLGIATGGLPLGDDLLRRFSDDRRRARQRYRAFVEEGIDRPPPTEEELVAAASEHLPVRRPSAEVTRAPWLATRPSLEQILAGGDSIGAIETAYREHGYSMREIADAIGCHYATISRRLRAPGDSGQ